MILVEWVEVKKEKDKLNEKIIFKCYNSIIHLNVSSAKRFPRILKLNIQTFQNRFTCHIRTGENYEQEEGRQTQVKRTFNDLQIMQDVKSWKLEHQPG